MSNELWFDIPTSNIAAPFGFLTLVLSNKMPAADEIRFVPPWRTERCTIHNSVKGCYRWGWQEPDQPIRTNASNQFWWFGSASEPNIQNKNQMLTWKCSQMSFNHLETKVYRSIGCDSNIKYGVFTILAWNQDACWPARSFQSRVNRMISARISVFNAKARFYHFQESGHIRNLDAIPYTKLFRSKSRCLLNQSGPKK